MQAEGTLPAAFTPATGRDDIVAQLAAHGINPTPQRVEIARVLLRRCTHLSADAVFHTVDKTVAHVSKATVYNTLGLFARKGLIREVIVDPTKVFYDSNIAPHHHVYNVTTGELTDVDAQHLRVEGMPPLPAATELEGMDVIVRIRSAG